MAKGGKVEANKEEKVTAQLEVRDTFKGSREGTVAGCIVQEGVINRNNFVRVVGEGVGIYHTKEGGVGELSSLKRYKDDVREVRSGEEGGITRKYCNDRKGVGEGESE